ncbi:uncharacterized protein LOC128989437 isoform X3 [Macrosteles quadrilineatus]|uniref:uncharacterized protein LOC128989437 isoform X3 n=1 Tax=Macrosteles quadrilineatus TaxID=74068 RepID=UPI0023E16CC9|nr:uncharacterized protein LOC128989437 isoform X3 [Macrosteles quadrilineatus]
MPNKQVTFGDVITYPNKPKSDKSEAEKTVSIKNRFNCGALRNSLKLMAGGNGNHLIAIRLVRSKLRKREDNLHTTVTTNHNNNVIHHQQQTQQVPQQQQQPQCQEVVVSCPRDSQESLPPPFLWTNSRCSTTASSQYTLYNNDEDNLVHSVACEEPRECKGLRKNLSGKWRRLVKKKPPQEVYTLPAELRDQLKTIYVY